MNTFVVTQDKNRDEFIKHKYAFEWRIICQHKIVLLDPHFHQHISPQNKSNRNKKKTKTTKQHKTKNMKNWSCSHDLCIDQSFLFEVSGCFRVIGCHFLELGVSLFLMHWAVEQSPNYWVLSPQCFWKVGHFRLLLFSMMLTCCCGLDWNWSVTRLIQA